MQEFFQITLIILLYILNLGLSKRPDYEDLEAINAVCTPYDSCHHGAMDLPFNNRTCECDINCSTYGDCCVNAGYSSTRKQFECFADETPFKHVYVISNCARNYAASIEVRETCENANDLTDPWAATPSTDIIRNVTYKNRYCAECNNANLRNLRSWELKVECNESITDPDYIRSNLDYITSGRYSNTWGFYFNEEFNPCEIKFKLPSNLENHVRFCRPNVVSSCDPSHRLKRNIEYCKAYMALIHIGNVTYRNPHCARCNNIMIGGRRGHFTCGVPFTGGILDRGKKPALSFTLLLDVNLSDGNRVGEVRDDRCPNRQMWDPFFKRCRRLVCAIPGYVMRNNKCVKP